MYYCQGKSQGDAGLRQPDTEGDLCQQPGVSRAFCSPAKSRCFSRTKRRAGFCSEEFVLCLQRIAKSRSKANCSLEGEKERPPTWQEQGAGGCLPRGGPALPNSLWGCSLPAGSSCPDARPGFPGPAFRPADLKEPNGEPQSGNLICPGALSAAAQAQPRPRSCGAALSCRREGRVLPCSAYPETCLTA